MSLEEKVKQEIRVIPDFPKSGILFKDITPLLAHPALAAEMVDYMADWASSLKPDYIAGIEARGFMLGFALAQRLNIGFIPLRKPGKLPREVFSSTYDLEYGTATLELHKEDLRSGSRVLIHDDLLATGGTMGAAYELIKKAGAEVAGFNFIIELMYLQGRQNLPELPILSLAQYA